MVDSKPPPAIPTWQRAVQSQKSTEESEKHGESGESPVSSLSDTIDADPPSAGRDLPAPAAPLPDVSEQTLQTEESTAPELGHVKSFLEDPAIQKASTEKKRAFLEGKGIAKSTIDKLLPSPSPESFKADEFQSFQQRPEDQHPAEPQQPPSPPQKEMPPPVITYPEFLVDAHKAAPIITPSRVWNTAYLVGAVVALVHGTHRYLVTPMADELAHARHDFAQHSHGKITELNDRLAKIASRVPEPATAAPTSVAAAADNDDDDAASEASDPTELFHRDIGIQTSPPSTPLPSTATDAMSSGGGDGAVQSHAGSLATIRAHLHDMLEQTGQVGEANRERQDGLNGLRHYIDTLLYASPHVGMWANPGAGVLGGSGGGATAGDEGGRDKEEDALEELKKQIRSFKGVLLSWKRFPAAVANGGPV